MSSEMDPFQEQQLSAVARYMREIGYLIRPGRDFVHIVAHGDSEIVPINITCIEGGIVFQTLWGCNEYARNNYSEYIEWANSLNLESFSVKFAVDITGVMVMTSNYYGYFEKISFIFFYNLWRMDIDKLLHSRECLKYLE